MHHIAAVKMQIFGSLKTGTYVVSRLLGFIMNIVLLAITGGYVHELVMDRIVQPVPIVMLVFVGASHSRIWTERYTNEKAIVLRGGGLPFHRPLFLPRRISLWPAIEVDGYS